MSRVHVRVLASGSTAAQVMGKGKEKADIDGPSRERTISWDDGQTKFMFDWYIKFSKEQYAGFKFKKHHHQKCDDALNKEFSMRVSATQVERHYRHYKENWKYVAVALSKSGNAFDKSRCMVMISKFEMASLTDRARRPLCKPIKFYHKMEELFTGTNADGSLAMDPSTCMNEIDVSDDGFEDYNDLTCYAPPEGNTSHDSDTLPSPLRPGATTSQVPSGVNSSSRGTMKRRRSMNSSVKKPSKMRSRISKSTEEINETLKALQESLAATAIPPLPNLADPHATLYEKIEVMTITTE